MRFYTKPLNIATFLVTVVAHCLAGCGGGDSHSRMIALLEKTAKRAETENEYVETKSVIGLEKELQNTRDSELEAQFMLNWQLAILYMNLGENQKAIDRLEVVHQLLPQAQPYLTDEQYDTLLFDTAMAHFRIAETQNCIHCATGEGCILPFRGAGLHSQRTGSRDAINYLQQLLERDPQHERAAWLLNIAYMTLGEHEQLEPATLLIRPEKFEAGDAFPAFKERAREIGVAEFSCAGGSVVEDIDNDGDFDQIVSNWDVRGQLRVYLNQGNGKFIDYTEQAGVMGITGGLNMVQADYDNDGDVDIFILRGAWLGKKGDYPNSLLQNDGHGRFRDVTLDVGLGVEHFPTQTAAWADYDNDGDLDLYIGNENTACQLFQNSGGTFKDVAREAGVQNGGFAKGVVWGDYDNDGWPDLFVSNGSGANRLFHNNGDGAFIDVAAKVGVSEPRESFPTWFWDFNNDGNLDIFVSSYDVGVHYVAREYQGDPIALRHLPGMYQGDGKGGFINKARELGLATVVQPMGANFGDIDNDGFLDFYLGTGYTEFYAIMPNRLFHNQRGKKFNDVTFAARVGHVQKGHGVSFADFDRDGDQDIFVETGGAFRGDAFRNLVFENPGAANHFVEIKLIGVKSNRSAIGARIRVDFEEKGNNRTVYRRVNSGGSFGANPLAQHIGIGAATSNVCVEVYWPTTNKTQRFENVKVDQRYEVTEDRHEIRTISK